jgi:hypothetical protein
MSWFGGKKSEHDDNHGSPKFVQKRLAQQRREAARKAKMDAAEAKKAKHMKDKRGE